MYVLHYYPDTASLAVRLVLTELGIPHEPRLINREAGALSSAEYRALHPLGKIPAMETPDGPMFETAAILLYLSDKHASPLAPAPGDADRAAFLKWYFFTSSNIHPCLMDIFYPERVAGDGNVTPVLAHASARMEGLVAALEQAAQPEPLWLSPHQPSLLGYYLAMLLHWLGSIPPGQPGHLRLADYPALHRVLAYLETRPATQTIAADENLGPTPFTKP